MVAALIRRKGILALALSSSLHGKTSVSAFHHNLRRSVSTTSSRSSILRNNKSTTSTIISDDPSLTNDNDDYEGLKQSRPMRIHARIIDPNNNGDGGATIDNNNTIGASSASAVTTKIIHFQRHGQGTHNEIYKQWTERTGKPLDLSETDPTKNPLLTNIVLDAPLTQKGRDQCAKIRSVVAKLEGVELVIVSPLTRALQTAHITFQDHLPYNTKTTPSSSSSREVKWIAHEGIREELGMLLCNKRRPLSETELEFPEVDYTYLPYAHNGKEDVLWNNHVDYTTGDDGIPKRETMVDMSHRAYHFLVDFVHRRPEREMAVVGHSAWLLAMTGAVLDVGEEDVSLITPMFGQAELRSMELRFFEQ